MGRAILRVAIGSMVKHGVMSEEGYKYMAVGSTRKKEGGYMYDDWMGEETGGEVTEAPRMKIMAPVYQTEEAVSNFGNQRLRGSYAHEVGHSIRVLSNKLLWEGLDEAMVTGLSGVKRLFVGGFRVGSNKQGSESIGNLFSEVVKLRAGGGFNDYDRSSWVNGG